MDTPSQEPSNAPLNVDSGAEAFAALLDPVKEPPKSAEAQEAEALEAEAAKAAEAGDTTEEVADDAAADEGEKVTILVDGKTVELTKAELADHYKNGLRQADYTKKTMEAADLRKTAEAEVAKARQERDAYAQGLTRNALQLEAVLEQSKQIDWDTLIANDPVEALKQQHLLQKRQEAYQQTRQQLDQIAELSKAEQAEQLANHTKAQQEALLAKLPEWKDPVKAKAESDTIKTYLKTQGFDDAELANIRDHRAILLARDAMKYRELVSKAQATAKKVQALPQKVMKPGVGDTPNLDGRSTAMKQLGKTGRVEDAAKLFEHFV